jgi:hypothetical protein
LRSLVVEAKSLESAQALYSALSEFHPELLGSEDEGFRVRVPFGTNGHPVIAVLNAVEQYVIERKSPARIDLDGRQYTFQPD